MPGLYSLQVGNPGNLYILRSMAEHIEQKSLDVYRKEGTAEKATRAPLMHLEDKQKEGKKHAIERRAHNVRHWMVEHRLIPSTFLRVPDTLSDLLLERRRILTPLLAGLDVCG
jgi:hypothetical protein